jgi:hypothetical protein
LDLERSVVSRSTVVARHVAAVLTLTTMTLVLASPLWHTHRHELVSALAASSALGPDNTQLCDTGDHGSDSLGPCPICLSQRLLGQSHAESTHQLSVPDGESALLLGASLGVAITVAASRHARSPPTT